VLGVGLIKFLQNLQIYHFQYTTQFVSGLIGHLQQAFRNLCTWRKDPTYDKCQNRKSDDVLVIRYRGRHHLHASPKFKEAFGSQKPKKISNAQSCFAASGDAMNSIWVYEVDLWIKGQKFFPTIFYPETKQPLRC
jgi:hypothetical protein